MVAGNPGINPQSRYLRVFSCFAGVETGCFGKRHMLDVDNGVIKVEKDM